MYIMYIFLFKVSLQNISGNRDILTDWPKPFPGISSVASDISRPLGFSSSWPWWSGFFSFFVFFFLPFLSLFVPYLLSYSSFFWALYWKRRAARTFWQYSQESRYEYEFVMIINKGYHSIEHRWDINVYHWYIFV